MRYHLKNRIFSLGGAFDIVDDQGTPAFRAEARLISLGKSLDLYDYSGNALAHIQQELLAFTPTYNISQNGETVLTVHKRMFTWTPQFDIEGIAGFYTMNGDWADWNFQIETGGQVVAWVSREFALFTEAYSVDIIDGADIPAILCLAIVMEEIVQR